MNDNEADDDVVFMVDWNITQQEFYVRLNAETAADDGGSPSQSENDLKASYERERESFEYKCNGKGGFHIEIGLLPRCS